MIGIKPEYYRIALHFSKQVPPLSSLLKIPTGLAPMARGALHDFGIQLELSSAKT